MTHDENAITLVTMTPTSSPSSAVPLSSSPPSLLLRCEWGRAERYRTLLGKLGCTIRAFSAERAMLKDMQSHTRQPKGTNTADTFYGDQTQQGRQRKAAKPAGKASITHGGFVWVRLPSLLNRNDDNAGPVGEVIQAIERMREQSSFQRFLTSMFPTTHSLALGSEEVPEEAQSQSGRDDTLLAGLASMTECVLRHPLFQPKRIRARLHVIDIGAQAEARDDVDERTEERKAGWLQEQVGLVLCRRALFGVAGAHRATENGSNSINDNTEAVIKDSNNNKDTSIFIELSPVRFSVVLVVVRCHSTLEWSVLTPAQYAVIKQHSREDKLICRAAHKLRDALQSLTLRQSSTASTEEESESQPECGSEQVNNAEAFPSGRALRLDLPALDVGASPGGWTEALLVHGWHRVVAIDPGEMSPDLMQKYNRADDNVHVAHCPRIRHMAVQAQAAAIQLLAEAAQTRSQVEGGIEDVTKTETYQLRSHLFSCLVCDVNADARFIMEDLLLPLVPLLVPGAPLILTLKLPRRAQSSIATKGFTYARERLGCFFQDFELHHFLGNTGSERTLIAYRREVDLTTPRLPSVSPSPDYVSFGLVEGRAKWKQELSRLVAFVNAHGRLPLEHGHSPKERKLGQWVLRQKRQRLAFCSASAADPGSGRGARGGWGCGHLQELEACEWWSWDDPNQCFLAGLEKLKTWIKQYGSLPPPWAVSSSDAGHISSWIAAQRRAFHRGDEKALSADHRTLLASVEGWTWTWTGDSDDKLGYDQTMACNATAELRRILGPRFRCVCGTLFLDESTLRKCQRAHAGKHPSVQNGSLELLDACLERLAVWDITST